MEIPWILITILVLILVLAIGFVVWKRKPKQKANYKTYLTIGAIWLAFGLVFEYGLHKEFSVMTYLGIIFLLAGLIRFYLEKKASKRRHRK